MSRDPHFACPCSTQRQAPTVRIHTRTTQATRTLSAPIQFSGTTEPDAICRRRCGEGASGRALCYGGGSGSLIPPHIHMQRTSSTVFPYVVARLRWACGFNPHTWVFRQSSSWSCVHSFVKLPNCRNLIKTLRCCSEFGYSCVYLGNSHCRRMASHEHVGSARIPECLGSPDHGAGVHSLDKRAVCINLITLIGCLKIGHSQA